jgi:type III pantothenate kinase
MILLLDIGNTRLKWAQLEGTTLGAQHASVHTDGEVGVTLERLFDEVSRPERVLISNVGGAEIGGTCAAAISERWGVTPEFVVSSARAAGVTNAYLEPNKLGVDRWLAVIAAYALSAGAACIVSVGTAMTVDAVDAHGRHLGGSIVPGPKLMTASLLKNTSDIGARMTLADSGAQSIFANHTAAAVHHGCTHALASLVERAMSELTERLGAPPRLILTGGATADIVPLIRAEFTEVPDLVLRGLAIIARETAGAPIASV